MNAGFAQCKDALSQDNSDRWLKAGIARQGFEPTV